MTENKTPPVKIREQLESFISMISLIEQLHEHKIKGERRSGSCCPIAAYCIKLCPDIEAIHVCIEGIYINDKFAFVPPPIVIEFISCFDMGYLPEFEQSNRV